jgi:hypothetical protein
MSVDQHAEVTTPTSRKGDSRRWRIDLLNRKSRPICNVVCNSLIFLPSSNIQCRYTQNPCHARAGCVCPTSRRAGQRYSRHGHGPGRTCRWPRLSCGRFSPIRFSLTGAVPSLGPPREGSCAAPPSEKRSSLSRANWPAGPNPRTDRGGRPQQGGRRCRLFAGAEGFSARRLLTRFARRRSDQD